MAYWMRFDHNGEIGFGTVDGDTITVYTGGMFDHPETKGKTVSLAAVEPLTPTKPGKMLALWNNFYTRAAKQGLDIPPEPLYFMKPESSFLTHGETIRRPRSYDGPIVFEGELGIVMGKVCKEITDAEAPDYIFGYTCVNDVTCKEILKRDSSFTQWIRAKGFDTFGVFGPVVATGIDPTDLVVRSVLDGRECQNYPVNDMIFQPARLVSLISQDMTLYPGDVIACGTSYGTEPMSPGSTIEIIIEGVGTLRNGFG